MIKKLTERDKKFLIAGGIFVVFYILYSFVVAPVVTQQKQTEQQIRNQIAFIEKYYGFLNQKPYYDRENQEIKIIQSILNQKFLPEAKPALAAASMQRILEGIARQTSVQVDSVRIEKTKYIKDLLAVPVAVTLRSNLRKLAQFISQIENHSRFLVIEEMIAQRTNKFGAETLKTRLVVSGFIQQKEPGSVKAI